MESVRGGGGLEYLILRVHGYIHIIPLATLRETDPVLQLHPWCGACDESGMHVGN